MPYRQQTLLNGLNTPQHPTSSTSPMNDEERLDNPYHHDSLLDCNNEACFGGLMDSRIALHSSTYGQ
ncbi:hypothetical protein Hypma_009363 [Hypsizygus marmoreus]|uniref:Uncharacterized protein n=1 Tax=Hypsizygus marmoreus TaxID=39966 RepID=A0A369JMP0_HYPMA|nr:hypothetical protein Hypma_009363 [Hypsizygus marmoreus]